MAARARIAQGKSRRSRRGTVRRSSCSGPAGWQNTMRASPDQKDCR
ncbi:MAG: hypothetical protein M0C28_06435 [Candidatus Moduliflexus flocculans]|nr:hypothetical protein [Candidatus Moduliflexus flocculans]